MSAIQYKLSFRRELDSFDTYLQWTGPMTSGWWDFNGVKASIKGGDELLSPPEADQHGALVGEYTRHPFHELKCCCIVQILSNPRSALMEGVYHRFQSGYLAWKQAYMDYNVKNWDDAMGQPIYVNLIPAFFAQWEQQHPDRDQYAYFVWAHDIQLDDQQNVSHIQPYDTCADFFFVPHIDAVIQEFRSVLAFANDNGVNVDYDTYSVPHTCT